MHTLSSARRTCMASASAVEWTATLAMPSSLHARRMRNAISPRLAMRILSNMRFHRRMANSEWRMATEHFYSLFATRYSPLFNNDQRFAEFHRLAILDENLDDGSRARRRNLVHGLHRLDDHKRLTDRDLRADLDEGLGARLRRPIGGADHRRGHDAGMFGQIGGRRRHRRGRWIGLRRRNRNRNRGHRSSNSHIARHAHPKARALDLDFGETGFIQQ